MGGTLPSLGHDIHGRTTHLLALDSWHDWPSDLSLPSTHFCLLVAADAFDIRVDAISSFAASSIDAGCAYLCAWGPGCKFVHDAFDQTAIGLGLVPPDKPVLITSWHPEVPIEEALEFLCVMTAPDEPFEASCHAVVAAVIGNPLWADAAKRFLAAEPAGFWVPKTQ